VGRWTIAALVVLSTPERARADFVPEIPGLEALPADARAAALAGTGVASVENATALHLNPAAIALVPRTEIHSSVLYQRHDLESGYFDQAATGSLRASAFTGAGFAYPVAVYRGALGVGGSFRRSSLFDRELVRSGTQPDGAREDELLEEKGSLDEWTLGAGLQISPRAFVGVSATLVTGSLHRRSDFEFHTPDSSYVFHATTNTDLSGIAGRLGLLYFPASRVRVGLRIELPRTVTFEGTETREGSPASFRVDDELTYPLSAAIGGATLVGPFLVVTDLELVPYSLLELNGDRLRTLDRREGYRDLAILRLGIEHRTSDEIRLRVGYRYEPDPYRLILAEVQNGDPDVAVMEEAQFETERQVVSGGIGALLEDALLIDFAAEWSRAEKAGTNVDQSDETARFLLTTSYRF
jgi:hypothetical protein